MKNMFKVLVLSLVLGTTGLMSGCIIIPVGHHGWYR